LHSGNSISGSPSNSPSATNGSQQSAVKVNIASSFFNMTPKDMED